MTTETQEPRTEAGRRLLQGWPKEPWVVTPHDIRDIEAEATRLALEGVAERLPDALMAAEGVYTTWGGGSEKQRRKAYIKAASAVLALLASTEGSGS